MKPNSFFCMPSGPNRSLKDGYHLSDEEAAKLVQNFHEKWPQLKQWHKRMMTPMSVARQNELVYNVLAVRKCLKIAKFLGLEKVVARYETFLSRAESELMVDWAKRHPLRRPIHYAEIGRQLFPVQEMPDRALPIYDRDPDVTGYVLDPEHNVEKTAKAEYDLDPKHDVKKTAKTGYGLPGGTIPIYDEDPNMVCIRLKRKEGMVKNFEACYGPKVTA